MAFSIATLVRNAFGRPPKLVCDSEIWRVGVAELRRRTEGFHESGAFLLGSKGRTRHIKEFVFYDDVDPHALETGIVKIDGNRLGDLWTHCRKTRREVIADIHVHPGDFGQSASDMANPIIAELGHIAIILPHYATRATMPGRIGVFEYLGGRKWRDRSFERPSTFYVGWWPWR